ELLGNLIRVLASEPRAAYVHAPQRLAQLHPRRVARLATELHDPAYLGDLGKKALVGLADLGPACQEDALRGALAGVGDKVPPQMVGEERHDWRDDPQARYERKPECSEGRVIVRVE